MIAQTDCREWGACAATAPALAPAHLPNFGYNTIGRMRPGSVVRDNNGR